MSLARALLLTMALGAAANPQRALPPVDPPTVPGVAMSDRPRTRADVIRQIAGKIPGTGKLARKAKRRAILAGLKDAARRGSNQVHLRFG